MRRKSPDENPFSEFWTKAEFAEVARVTERTVDRWHETRTGPPRLKVGKTCYYRKALVRDWLDRRTAQAEQAYARVSAAA